MIWPFKKKTRAPAQPSEPDNEAGGPWTTIERKLFHFRGQDTVVVDLQSGRGAYHQMSPTNQETRRELLLSPEQRARVEAAVARLLETPFVEFPQAPHFPDTASITILLPGSGSRRPKLHFMNVHSELVKRPELLEIMQALDALTLIDWMNTSYRVKRISHIAFKEGVAQYRCARDDDNRVCAFAIKPGVTMAGSWIENARVEAGPVFLDVDGDGATEALVTTRHEREENPKPYWVLHVFKMEPRAVRQLCHYMLDGAEFQFVDGHIVLSSGRRLLWNASRNELTSEPRENLG